MGKMKIIMAAGLLFLTAQILGPVAQTYGAPPIQSEAEISKKAEEKKEKKKKKSPEEVKKEKETAEIHKSLRNIRKRQARDERSIRVRANIFPSIPPGLECTGADKARARLDEVFGDGGVVILGDVNIDSKNESDVKENKGSINNEVNVNIINQNNKRC